MKWLWIAGGVAVVWASVVAYFRWRVNRDVDRTYQAWREGKR